MEYGNELFQRTFSHLRASPRLREELLAMTEQKTNERKPKRYVARRLLVTAMVLALAFALAMGANAATDGELYEATIGKLVYTLSLSDGGKAEIFENGDGSFTVVEHPNGEDGETAKSGEDVSYEEFCEVETDEEGKVIAAQGESGPEIGVEKDGEELTRPVEELMEGTDGGNR